MVSKIKITFIFTFLLTIFVYVNSSDVDDEVASLAESDSSFEDEDYSVLSELVGKIRQEELDKQKRELASIKNELNTTQILKNLEASLQNRSIIDIRKISKIRKEILEFKINNNLKISDEEKSSMELIAIAHLEEITLSSLENIDESRINIIYRNHGGVTWLQRHYIENILRRKSSTELNSGPKNENIDQGFLEYNQRSFMAIEGAYEETADFNDEFDEPEYDNNQDSQVYRDIASDDMEFINDEEEFIDQELDIDFDQIESEY